MKRLTADVFLKSRYPSGLPIVNSQWEEDMPEIMESYAEHCEESSWVSVEDGLPERWDGYPLTKNCLLFNGREYLIGFYSYAHSQWESDEYDVIDGVTHWRPLPLIPKKFPANLPNSTEL